MARLADEMIHWSAIDELAQFPGLSCKFGNRGGVSQQYWPGSMC